MRKLLAPILFVLVACPVFAQEGQSVGNLNLPLQHDLHRIYEREVNRSDKLVHTGMRPLVESFSVSQDSLVRYGWEDYADQQPTVTADKKAWNFIWRKLRTESMIIVDKDRGDGGEFKLWIDPVFDLEGGIDPQDDRGKLDTLNLFRNARGIQVRGHVGKKVSFFSSFYETQTILPQYVERWGYTRGEWRYSEGAGAWGQENAVVPGMGRTKEFKSVGFDFNLASGYVSFTPLSWWNVQAGTGKHFIGEGYRSLLLSDNAFNYPYLRSTLQTPDGKLQYTNIWSSLSSLNRIPVVSTNEPLYQPKAGTFHYLSYSPIKQLQLGLFEGVIWNRWDSTGTTDFDGRFLNPVVGMQSATIGTNALNNALIGLTAKVMPITDYVFYSQYIFDANSRLGYQFGAKAFDLAGITNLFVQAEYNSVNPGTYNHRDVMQTYSHFNQELAHPLGAGFNEVIGIAAYRWKDLSVRVKLTNATYQTTLAGQRYGSVNYNPNTDGALTGEETNDETVRNIDLRLAYLVNPATNMNLVFGVMNRTDSGNLYGDETLYVYAGFKTMLTNTYLDF